MIRVIKRYESRKLYDTEESRYVSLEDIAQWVREGQEVRVTDNATSADVSAQVLTQIILDEGKKGSSFLPTELLHELVRAGEKALTDGVDQFQGRMSRIVQSSIDRLGPVRRAREEMGQLRDRLSQLERALDELDQGEATAPAAEESPAPRKRRTATKTATTSKTRKPKTATAKSVGAAKAGAAKKASAKLVEVSAAEGKPAAKKTTRRRSAASAKKAVAETEGGSAKTTAAKTTRRKTAASKTPTKKTAAAAKATSTASADS